MADDREDELRLLRRLAKSYGISFKRPSDEWPECHRRRFGDIRELGDTKFHTYSENVTVRSIQEPWTRQIKSRTQWLVSRACDLAMNVQPKESGWRLGLENDVMHRFLVEVACPKCRARIWRSEIEASDYKADSRWVQELEERRKSRKPCQCPFETGPRDYYELGTSLLFDDRIEEIVTLDSALKDLPKKKIPDRTFGLKTTEKVNDLLAKLAVRMATSTEAFEFTPFKLATNPPIFPFLVLEAKSDSSKNGFYDIQTQTAFPIWKFLNLQKQLQIKTECVAEEPLVWFLGNRGSEWKVYGCYIDETDGKPRYNIHPLWGGDLMTQDGALQLILIVDYILDWARDIYRPSVLRQLKSLAFGKGYDEVSIGFESDIYSVRDRVFDWIGPATDNPECEEDLEAIVEEPEPVDGTSPVPLASKVDLLEGLPNTKIGSFRSASHVKYYFNSLNLTEENVESLLIISQGPDDKLSMSSAHAKKLADKLQPCSDLIVTTQHTLDEIELMWTGEKRKTDSPFSSASDVEVYAIIEYSCFMSPSWDIVKELTCFAVSKPALHVLQECGNPKDDRGARQLQNVPNACPSTSLYEAIECLLSDSALQNLQASISSTRFSICPSTARKDKELQSFFFTFCSQDHSRIGHVVEEYSKCVRNQPSKPLKPISLAQYLRSGGKGRKGRKGYEAFINQKQTERESWFSKYRRRTANRSFTRRSSKFASLAESEGHGYSCGRCSKDRANPIQPLEGDGKKSYFLSNGHLFGGDWEPCSFNNTVLVQAVVVDTASEIRQDRNHLCLFILSPGPDLGNDSSVRAVIEEHLNRGQAYHTLLHGAAPGDEGLGRFILWNLPCTYRPFTKREEKDLKAWNEEIKEGREPKLMLKKRWIPLWDHSQMLLYYLRLGYQYNTATEAVKSFRDSRREYIRLKSRWGEHDDISNSDSDSIVGRVDLDSFWPYIGKHR